MSDSELRRYSMKEIEEHTSNDSLWLLIDNGVYDVSKYLDEHPGGPEPMMEWAGKDATDAFEDIGHSSDARTLMLKYKIGELSEMERKEKVQINASSSCFWCQVLVPVGVVATAFLAYKIYARFQK